MLDGGDAGLLCFVAALLSVVPIVIVVFTRSASQHLEVTQLDSLIIRYGFWIFFLGMCMLYHYELLPKNWYFSNRMEQRRQQRIQEHPLPTADK